MYFGQAIVFYSALRSSRLKTAFLKETGSARMF